MPANPAQPVCQLGLMDAAMTDRELVPAFAHLIENMNRMFLAA
jgi:hypothetical protein